MDRHEEVEKKAREKLKSRKEQRREILERQRRQKREKRRREAKKRAKKVDFFDRVPWISEPWARQMHGRWGQENCRGRLKRVGVKMRTEDYTEYIEGRGLHAVAKAQGLGRPAGGTGVFSLKTFESMDDLDAGHMQYTGREPLGGYGKFKRRLSITENLIRNEFQAAVQRIREDARDVPFNDQPRKVRRSAWAAKDGDPRNGPVEELEDCFPLEVAWKANRLLWMARPEEDEGDEG